MNWFAGHLELSTVHGMFHYYEISLDRAQALLDYIGNDNLLGTALYTPYTICMGATE